MVNNSMCIFMIEIQNIVMLREHRIKYFQRDIPLDSLFGQPSLLDKFQSSERYYVRKKKEVHDLLQIIIVFITITFKVIIIKETLTPHSIQIQETNTQLLIVDYILL